MYCKRLLIKLLYNKHCLGGQIVVGIGNDEVNLTIYNIQNFIYCNDYIE